MKNRVIIYINTDEDIPLRVDGQVEWIKKYLDSQDYIVSYEEHINSPREMKCYYCGKELYPNLNAK